MTFEELAERARGYIPGIAAQRVRLQTAGFRPNGIALPQDWRPDEPLAVGALLGLRVVWADVQVPTLLVETVL